MHVFRSRCHLAALAAVLLLVSSCQTAPLVGALPSLRVEDAVAPAPLSKTDQEAWAMLSFMTTAGQGAATGMGAYTALTTGGSGTEGPFYSGPFPNKASDLPTDYTQRQTGDWLSQNPKTTRTDGTETVETYFTPAGAPVNPPAYQKRVTRLVDAALLIDMLALPPITVAELPAFFARQITMPSDPVIERAEETYRAYTEGAVAGTALGYRWAVYDAKRNLVAWVRALQVSQTDGNKVDRYEIFSDYTAGASPTRFSYGTYFEKSKVGQHMDQTRTADKTTMARGQWIDLATGKTIELAESIAADGGVIRTSTCRFGAAQEMVVSENYRPDGSGTGTVTRTGHAAAATRWGKDGIGQILFESGIRPYASSRGASRPTGSVIATYDGVKDPTRVVVDPAGAVWVYNKNGEIAKLTPATAQIENFRVATKPESLCVGYDQEGYTWLVTKIQNDHHELSKIGPNGIKPVGPIQLSQFLSIAIAPEGHILVGSQNRKLLSYDSSGARLKTVPLKNVPSHLAAGPGGKLWVADDAKQLTPYDLSGKQLAAGKTLDRVPDGMATTAYGALWLSYRSDHQLVRLDVEGTETHRFTNKVSEPVTLAGDAFGNVWVAGRTGTLTLLAR